MENIILIIVLAFVAFEVIEHIGIPVCFYFMERKKRSITGIESLLGEIVEVRHWHGTRGQVIVKGELWKAVGDAPLMRGDKAIIQDIKGLTLEVTSVGDASEKTL